MRKLLAIFTLLLFALSGFAQDKIEVQAPNLVSVDEQFNVTFVIEGSAPTDFHWSEGEDFQLVWGPQKGSMTRRSNINGNVSNTTQTTYTYILLPKSEGKFKLPAARATVNGHTLHSTTPEIEVVPANSDSRSSSSSRRSGSSQNESSSSQTATTVSNDDIYLTLELSKRNAVVGETITATLKLYQRVNLVGFENIKFPTFTGFWSQEVNAPTSLEFRRENVNGKIYNVALVRSWNLVPQRAGSVVIEPTEMVSVVNVRVNRPSTGSIFDEFFQNDYQTIRKRLSSGSVTVNVTNLPSGAPASFGGGVGNFNMSASLSRSELNVHDAASLEIRITGRGNLALISAPEVDFPPDFEVYEVKVSDIPGGKLFEYPFIARSHGDFTIGPVEYSYYNISSRNYVTLSSDPLHVSVMRGGNSEADSSSGTIVSGVQRRDVRDMGSDIRFIEVNTPSFMRAGAFFVGSLAFWIIALGLCVLGLSSYYILKLNRKRRADVVRLKTRGAVKLARKRLSSAEGFLKKSLYSAFYEELHKALIGYVADKFNMDIADMSRENICVEFEKRNIAEEVKNKYIELIDACEYARYSPDSGQEAMSVHYEDAVGVISMIESGLRQNMKKRKNATLPLVVLLLMLMPQFALASEFGEIESEAASPVELWASGVEAYQNGDWTEAIEAWNGIIEAGLESKEVYYNLGNAYYKSYDIAHAVLNYEKALKIDPSYADARFNLQLASNMVQDRIEVVPEFFLVRWLRSLSWLLPSTTWAIIGLVLFALSLFCAIVFLLGASRGKRIAGFVNGIVAFLLAIFVLSLAFRQRADYSKDDSAIVMVAVSIVKSSPSDTSSKELFVLHEGTKVKIINELGSWKNIELADGRQGWMKDSELEII